MAKPKEKQKLVLPKPETVPTAKPLAEDVQKAKERLEKATAVATKDGKLNKYDPKYRTALKLLKRAQRKLHKELLRVMPRGAVKPPEAAAAPAAPAEEKK